MNFKIPLLSGIGLLVSVLVGLWLLNIGASSFVAIVFAVGVGRLLMIWQLKVLGNI